MKLGLPFYEASSKNVTNGIEPLVTITHFDCPMHLITEYGGWRNRKMLASMKIFVVPFSHALKAWLSTGSHSMKSI